MSGARLHDGEVSVDADLVRALVDTQFPRWSHLPLRPVGSTGTDNVLYRLGDDLAVRLPRIGWAVAQVDKEQQWLPRLAPLLPVAVPHVLARGRPAGRYPWPWLITSWLEGDSALDAPPADGVGIAEDVARLLTALQRLDVPDPPSAGPRAGPLAAQDADLRQALVALDDEIDHDLALQVWTAAVHAPAWSRPPVWVHGDLLPGNLLVRAGRLTGVIDWAAAGVGDPACDLMVAWSLDPSARATLRAGLDVDDATWLRGAGWAVQQAALFIPYYRHTIPVGVAAARQRLDAVLADHGVV